MATVEPIQSFDMPTRPASCCNRDYALSKFGLLRSTIILCQLAGLISISAVIRPKYIGFVIPSPTQMASIFFSVFALVISIFIYLFNLMSRCNNRLRMCRWNLMVALCDIFFLLAMLGLGIACAMKEDDVEDYELFGMYYNVGSYASAAVFAFLSVIFYGISTALEIKQHRQNLMHHQFP